MKDSQLKIYSRNFMFSCTCCLYLQNVNYFNTFCMPQPNSLHFGLDKKMWRPRTFSFNLITYVHFSYRVQTSASSDAIDEENNESNDYSEYSEVILHTSSWIKRTGSCSLNIG